MKVKFFEDDNLKSLEKRINDFILENPIVLDVKHNTVLANKKILYTCLVVYNQEAQKQVVNEVKNIVNQESQKPIIPLRHK